MSGACLGEGEYHARFVTRRTLLGPPRVLGELPAASGSWERVISATSDASAQFDLSDDEDGECAKVLRDLVPWRSELELYRDDGLVHAGPVQGKSVDPDSATATVTSQDLSAWFDHRALLVDLTHRQVDLATIWAAYVAACLLVDDPGIVIETTPTGILGDRTVAASDAKMLAGELAELSRTGVDWTVANRTFYVGGQEISVVGALPGRLVDEHFRKAPTTRIDGSAQVNDAIVRGSDLIGRYGGPDPQDGVLLQSVAEESSIEDQGSADASARTWWDRAAEPLAYLEGDNALDPSAPITVEQLIPGLLVPVDVSGGGVVPLHQVLRLESASARWDSDGEDITIGLQPAGTTSEVA